jgi:peptide/nickel transport system permease protein
MSEPYQKRSLRPVEARIAGIAGMRTTSDRPGHTQTVPARQPGAPSAWRSFLRNRTAAAGLGLLILFGLTALFAPALAPHPPKERYPYHILVPPVTQGLHPETDLPMPRFWLGTDEHGRDVLSRILHGARVSLLIGIISVGISLSIGGTAGLLAGYWGGWFDALLMRIVDVMLAFPAILLAILIVAASESPGLVHAMVAVGIVGVPVYARLVRASVLVEKEKDYVQSCYAMGSPHWRVVLRHILPNVMAPLIVQVTLGYATAILDAAGLSFLGLGAQDPDIEWGLMLKTGKDLISTAWWVITFPGLAILLTVLGFNLFGDGLRDFLDPRRSR